jgi:hypothetical protein
MSTPDQPEATPLTRRRLREIRATGATPIITPDEAADAANAAETAAPDAPETEAPEEADTAASDAAEEIEPEPAPERTPEPSAPLPRASAPATIAAPMTEADVDLGVSPLTRRQARAQERIRTASVPIIQLDAPAAEPPLTKTPEPPAEEKLPEQAVEDGPAETAASDEPADGLDAWR